MSIVVLQWNKNSKTTKQRKTTRTFREAFREVCRRFREGWGLVFFLQTKLFMKSFQEPTHIKRICLITKEHIFTSRNYIFNQGTYICTQEF